ncbi:non-ribosomal peptide synthetase [Dactylosporangium sp. CA-233914]|uniref:non-ribosomal peptide synthetase n=1 Tax=Dactylosporangium sp. CA-233914 TaxID=3239934 RepID=UPI003D8CBAE9
MTPPPQSSTVSGTVHHRIWQQAQRAPDAVAVVDDDGAALTYRELTDRADAVARDLGWLDVATEQVVGVCWPRSVDGLVRVLGVLRAGAALLYLDPDWPEQRLRHMTAACTVQLVLDRWYGLRVLDVQQPPAAAVLPMVHGPLCYAVFTSGSTGTPKGVLVEHPGVLNMAVELARIFRIGPGTTVLQFANWSWDAAMCEILMTLTAGGTLMLAPPAVRGGGPGLAALLRRHAVNVVTLTPSVLDALPTADLPALRTVVAVGEPCHPALVARWSTPDRQVFNGYGPTETTVAATVAACTPGADVHIGTPLPNVTTRVVDEHGHELVAGKAGELLIGGIGVARGYAGSVAATAARFTTDGLGRRWYHTGDLVARRPDGALDYVGRSDDQIKIRGHRIEFGEIEHVIAELPAVRSCAVTTVADQLVAFVVAAGADPVAGLSTGPAADPDHLPDLVLAHARTQLAAFAVPSTAIVVPALPLTGNGKLDRDALTAWAAARIAAPSAVAADAAPAAEATLRMVLQVVSDVLGLPVGPGTDFIDAGGHSLLVAQLCVALSETFGREVPYLTVAMNRTPAALAAAIDATTGPVHPHPAIGGASSTRG